MTKAEVELVVRAQKGDEQAFNELFQLYYKQAYYIALKISNCDADAKDAVQETFIQIKRSIKDLQETKNFRKWMAQIVLSKCNKIFRKNKYAAMDPSLLNTLPQEEKRTYMSGHQNMEELSRKEILLKLMSKLTCHQREILFLTYFEQMSMKEMAQVLSIPEGTVKSRLVSAKATLKKHVSDFEARNGIKMHANFLPILLLAAARKESLAMTGVKPNVSFASIASTQPMMAVVGVAGMMSVAIVSVSTAVGLQQALLKQEAQSILKQPIMEENTYFKYEGKEYSHRDIYFLLRDWGHCEVEIKQKTSQEYSNIQPFYDFLKGQASPYYEKLTSLGWTISYENYKK